MYGLDVGVATPSLEDNKDKTEDESTDDSSFGGHAQVITFANLCQCAVAACRKVYAITLLAPLCESSSASKVYRDDS